MTVREFIAHLSTFPQHWQVVVDRRQAVAEELPVSQNLEGHPVIDDLNDRQQVEATYLQDQINARTIELEDLKAENAELREKVQNRDALIEEWEDY